MRTWAESAEIKVDPRVDLSTSCVVKDVLKNTELISIPESLVRVAADEKDLVNQLPVPGPNGDGKEKKKNESKAMFMWSAEELAMLRGSRLEQRAREIQKELKEMGIKKEDFAYIRSNGIDFDNKTHLIPFALESADIDSASCGLAQSGGMFFSKPKYNVVARRDMKAGEALAMGRYSAAEDDLGSLFLEYGALPDSITGRYTTHVPIDVSISGLDKFKDDKVEILGDEELTEKATFTLKSTSGSKWTPPDDLDAYLRLMCLVTQDAYLLENIFRREVWGFMGLPVSLENEKALCEFMIGTCEDALDGYDNAFDDKDETKSEMAKYIISQEIQVLEAAKKSYTGRLAGVDQLVYYTERRLGALDLLRPLDESEIVGDYVHTFPCYPGVLIVSPI